MKYTERVMGGSSISSGFARRSTLLLAACLVLTACSSDSSATVAPTSIGTTAPLITAVPTSPPTTSPTTTATPTSVEATIVEKTVEEEVLEAYLAAWDVIFVAIGDPPNADDELLLSVLSEPQLSTTRAAIAERLAAEQFTDFPENSEASHQVEVIETTNVAATVQDCFVDDSFRAGSDGPVGDAEVATGSWVGSLDLVNGAWLVSRLDRVEREEGSAECVFD